MLQKNDKYAEIKTLIKQIYHRHKGRFGYRRITLVMKEKGIIINHKTVMRLMKILGLKSIIRARKYRSYRGEQGSIAPNVLERNFKADQPNRKWATDVTEFNVSGNKLYLSPIIDLYNGEIISYDLSERPVFIQVMNMLKKSFRKIKNTEHHPPLGSRLAVSDESLSSTFERKRNHPKYVQKRKLPGQCRDREFLRDVKI